DIAAAKPKKRIPLLKANRSPLLCNCLGRKRSCESIEVKTGNPLKAVLAAAININAVANYVCYIIEKNKIDSLIVFFTVFGLIAGGFVFMILSGKKVFKALKKPDYAYYLGGY
ncbi:MAG: hypothetical protein RLZZ115_3318, partial [Cyanobacteriota bacterium]